MIKSLITLFILSYPLKIANIPYQYSLRTDRLLPPPRHQSWGTCWAFATICSIESNLIINHLVSPNINLSEYYLDKFNGFNKNQEIDMENKKYLFHGSNYDDPKSGITVHQGGDYLVSAAFNANFGGFPKETNNEQLIDDNHQHIFGLSETTGIKLLNYKDYKFFAQDIEFISLEKNKYKLQFMIKESILKHGAVGSVQFMQEDPFDYKDGLQVHYYSPSSHPHIPNHAINIVGWNDFINIKGQRGAWLTRDSDHKDGDKFITYFYTPYSDIYTAKDKWLGAVVFKNVIWTNFNNIYSHSLHGWRYSTTNTDISKVANKFKIKDDEKIVGVGIFSTTFNYKYKINIASSLAKKNTPLAILSGILKNPGFHYLKIPSKIRVNKADDIYIILQSANNSYAYEASFTMPLLLTSSIHKQPDVNSKANREEGFYLLHGKWHDFSTYKDQHNKQQDNSHAMKNDTANLSLTLYTQKL